VATLVAHGTPPQDVFAAVTLEVGQLLAVTSASMGRYDPDGMFTTVAAWAAGSVAFPVGRRWLPEGKNVTTLVFESGRPARVDDFGDASGAVGVVARAAGYRSAVGTPIMVEGRLWGVMTAASTAEEPLPLGTETRLASFTELVATAIANAESRAELAASRVRIVAASDEARRRIERDLHDGAQQQLVSLGLDLRVAEATVPAELEEARQTIRRIASEIHGVIDELREISRGIHPAILSEGGLGPALRTLARRSPIQVELGDVIEQRLPESIEVATYYVVSEALTNAAKHANASRVDVELSARDGRLRLSIRDDGVGGAEPARGSGLVGLSDRVEALGGSIEITSPPGRGTHLVVSFPLQLDLTVDSALHVETPRASG
jgi:signal transduction histidine kinase